jgi:hypothetical protein
LQLMKQNIHVTPAEVIIGDRRIAAFNLSFSYPDRIGAQMVVSNLVRLLTDTNLKLAAEQPGQSLTLKVFDPASRPQVPSYPNRLAIALAGLGAGTVLGGILAVYRRARIDPPIPA